MAYCCQYLTEDLDLPFRTRGSQMIVAMAWRGCMQFRAGQQAPSQQRPCKLSPSFSSLATSCSSPSSTQRPAIASVHSFTPRLRRPRRPKRFVNIVALQLRAILSFFLVFSSCQAGLVRPSHKFARPLQSSPRSLRTNFLEAAGYDSSSEAGECI